MTIDSIHNFLSCFAHYDDDNEDGAAADDDEPCGYASSTFRSQRFLILSPHFASTADNRDHCYEFIEKAVHNKNAFLNFSLKQFILTFTQSHRKVFLWTTSLYTNKH